MYAEKLKEAIRFALENWLLRNKLWILTLLPYVPPVELIQKRNGQKIYFTRAERWELFPDELTLDFSRTSLSIVELIDPWEICGREPEKTPLPAFVKEYPNAPPFPDCPYYSFAQCAFFRKGNRFYAFVWDSSKRIRKHVKANCPPLIQVTTQLTIPYFQSCYESVHKYIIPGWIAIEGILELKTCSGCPYIIAWKGGI